MANLPADILNQSLDAAGIDYTLGDPEEGSRPAQVCLRAYGECRKQLLRAVHWDFARKTAPLTLLADATGQTTTAGTVVPTPWTYEYAYPIDCMKARFIPWNNYAQGSGFPNGNIAVGSQPAMTGLGQPPINNARIRPARFTVATDFNYPVDIVPGAPWWETHGVSPTGRTVVLTNVLGAQLVYTADMPYPNTWDAQFRAALVALIASEIAMPLSKDKKFGVSMRASNIAIAKEKITQARITDGNEGWFNTDHVPDFIRVRASGGGRGGGWGDGAQPGVWGYGFDACAFADGSAY